MKVYVIVFIFLSLMLTISCDRLTKDEITTSTKVIQSIPENERITFLAYTLGQGYMQEVGSQIIKKYPFPFLLRISKRLEKKFQAIKKPKYFATNLYQFVKNEYELNSRQMFKLVLRKKLCYRGKCVDLKNIGELFCPF